MNYELTSQEKRRGSLMVESIVALSVAVVGLLGVFGLLTQSLAVSKDVGEKFVAVYLASEGIELVKSLIDKNYTDGLAWNDGLATGNYEVSFNSLTLAPVSGAPLSFSPESGIYDYAGTESTSFVRLIIISEIDRTGDGRTDEIKVVSRLTWPSRGLTQEIELEDHFFDWR